MKLGFQIKGSTKRKRIAENDTENNDEKKDLILSIEGTSIVTANNAANETKQLIIPLQKGYSQIEKSTIINTNTTKEVLDEKMLTIDDVAAAELIAELSGNSQKNGNSQLIIANADQSKPNGKKYVPILLANQAPELLGLNDDVERFKVDISLRPEAIDTKSDTYKVIPIEEFGAAMLRGMGWEGPKEEPLGTKTNSFDITPREYRLGLGATPKPPEEKGRGDKKKKEEDKKAWTAKANAVLAKQILQEGDLVWLREPLFAGRRAQVSATRGVPGLDRIRVCLESDARLVDVKRTDAVRLTGEELEERPYNPRSRVADDAPMSKDKVRRGDGSSSGDGSGVDVRGDRYPRGSVDRADVGGRDGLGVSCRGQEGGRGGRGSRDRGEDCLDKGRGDRDSGVVNTHADGREGNDRGHEGRHTQTRDQREIQDRHENKDGGRGRDRNREHDRDRGAGREEGTADKRVDKDKEKDTWVQVGIRVRIVSKKVLINSAKESNSEKNAYLEKGVVTHASREDSTIRLDCGDVVRAVKQRHLETVLPAIGERCVVLQGEYRGCSGVLLEKRKTQEEVVISLLSSEPRQVTVSMNFVAAIINI